LATAVASLHASAATMQKSWKEAWGHMSAKLKMFEQVTHFTCFTSTKLQLLTQQELQGR
jgi:hypothetical protein